MGELLTCPLDGTPLVMAADDGVYESGCSKCRRDYRFVAGTLTYFDAQPAKQAGHHRAILKIRADSETITLSDVVFTQTWGRVYQDQSIIVTEQRGADDDWQMVRVRSGAKHFEAREAGDRATVRGVATLAQGGLAAVFATTLTMYFYHWSFVLLLPFALVGTVILAGLRFKKHSTKQAFEPLRLAHLEREQWLLTQLQRYRLESVDVDERIRRQAKQIGEMKKLAADMQTAQGDYSHRLQVVERGIEALQHHHTNDRKLRDAISQAMEMVTIEYRAARALDYLPDDAIDRLTTTIAELDAIEAEKFALEAQLEANAEVAAIAPN